MSFPSGDFANQLNRQDFNEQAALDALRSEGSTKQVKKPPLSASAPANMQANAPATTKKPVAPEANLRTMIKWVKESPDVQKLDAKGAENLRNLCISQGTQAQQAENGIFSIFYSRATKDRVKLADTIEQTRCSELLKKPTLDAAEKNELRSILANETLDHLPKAERKAILAAFHNPAFITYLVEADDSRSYNALTNLVKHAYNQGQLYHLFQGVRLESPAQQADVQDALEKVMIASVEQSTKKGFLGKLFHAATPTLTIPLNPLRKELSNEKAAALDAILGAACANVILCNHMGHSSEEAATFGKFFGTLISASAATECTIPLNKTCFERPKVAQRIDIHNKELLSELDTLRKKAVAANLPTGAINRLISESRAQSRLLGLATSASNQRHLAIVYDALGVMNTLVTAKQQEEACVMAHWNEQKTTFGRLANQLKKPSSEQKKLLQKGHSLLNQAPSIDRYTQLKQCNEGLATAYEQRIGATLYAKPEQLSASAPAGVQVKRASPPTPTPLPLISWETLDAEKQWLGANWLWAGQQPDLSELTYRENGQYAKQEIANSIDELPPINAKSSAKEIQAFQQKLIAIQKALPTPWSIAIAIRELQQRKMIDSKVAKELLEMVKEAKNGLAHEEDFAKRLRLMDNIAHKLSAELAKMDRDEVEALPIAQLEPLLNRINFMRKSRPYQKMEDVLLLQGLLNQLNTMKPIYASVNKISLDEYKQRLEPILRNPSSMTSELNRLNDDVSIAIEEILMKDENVGNLPVRENPAMREFLDGNFFIKEFMIRRNPARYS